jgi:NTP pyrophosphatase (non-canonical NTP hydrolase)
MLDLQSLQKESTARAARWHGEEDWSVLEWVGAMCGEAGEAANSAKKLKRVITGMANIDARALSPETREQLEEATAKEAADTILYAVLLIEKVGRSAEDVVREVFNKKSIDYGFPERI